MAKKKILKRKIGSVYIDGKDYPVYSTSFETLSKDGKTVFYSESSPTFVQEYEEKEDKPKTTL